MQYRSGRAGEHGRGLLWLLKRYEIGLRELQEQSRGGLSISLLEEETKDIATEIGRISIKIDKGVSQVEEVATSK